MRRWRSIALAVLVAHGSAGAQPQPGPPPAAAPSPPGASGVVPERELQIIKALFDAGRFPDALERAKASLAQAGFSDPQRIELYRVAALSAFNLGDVQQARALFFSLLQLDPDYLLDPFAVPPPAIEAFEQVRTDNAATLNVSRQLIAFKAEKERRERAEADRQKQARVATRLVERRSGWVNLVPFGIPQFQQGRPIAGAIYGGLQASLGIASLVGFFGVQSLMRIHSWTLTDQKGANSVVLTVRGTPYDKEAQSRAFSALQIGAGAGFFALWAVMLIDGFVNHVAEVVTETKPTTLTVSPVPGGAAAQLTFRLE